MKVLTLTLSLKPSTINFYWTLFRYVFNVSILTVLIQLPINFLAVSYVLIKCLLRPLNIADSLVKYGFWNTFIFFEIHPFGENHFFINPSRLKFSLMTRYSILSMIVFPKKKGALGCFSWNTFFYFEGIQEETLGILLKEEIKYLKNTLKLHIHTKPKDHACVWLSEPSFHFKFRRSKLWLFYVILSGRKWNEICCRYVLQGAPGGRDDLTLNSYINKRLMGSSVGMRIQWLVNS